MILSYLISDSAEGDENIAIGLFEKEMVYSVNIIQHSKTFSGTKIGFFIPMTQLSQVSDPRGGGRLSLLIIIPANRSGDRMSSQGGCEINEQDDQDRFDGDFPCGEIQSCSSNQ